MNKLGIFSSGGTVLSYQIGETILSSEAEAFNKPAGVPAHREAVRMGRYNVWPAGVNNDDPNVCEALISGNRLLPSLIEKQLNILYGTGPQLYIPQVTAEGLITRQYIQVPEIQKWLESWRENGMADSYKTYLNKCIRSFYYSEGIYTKWRLTRGFTYGIGESKPVAGLEHVSELKCRFATNKQLDRNRTVEEKDFPFILVGDWSSGRVNKYQAFHKFDYSDPLGRSSAISYSKNPDQGDTVYASNVFFKGVKEWIRGCNATPEYINSFLENSLSARHHVIIPNAWIQEKVKDLKEICEANEEYAASGHPEEMMKTLLVGTTSIEIGTEYTPDLLDQVIKAELTALTSFLSGRGKNQGKIYATRSYYNPEMETIEKWEIQEISQKYKEFIEALIAYDKRADMVLLSAKGIDSSISNISSDGVVSKSGSDTYYNYMVYLTQQALPEEIICSDINYAIKLNFPEQYEKGVRLGFYRPTLKKQEEISPSDRLSSQNQL